MASLLAVDGARIELERGRAYVLGRAQDCDVVLPDSASSRRHARLSVGWSDSAITINDLGSRNGTYVNDRRVARPVLLDNHCRIRIGSTTYLLSLVDAGSKPTRGSVPHEEQSNTIVLDQFEELPAGVWSPQSCGGRVDGGSSFAGQLNVFNLIEVLRFLLKAKLAGTLHVALPGREERVVIRGGEVWHASYEGLEGLEALSRLASEPSGLFWLVSDSEPCDRTVNLTTAQLLRGTWTPQRLPTVPGTSR